MSLQAKISQLEYMTQHGATEGEKLAAAKAVSRLKNRAPQVTLVRHSEDNYTIHVKGKPSVTISKLWKRVWCAYIEGKLVNSSIHKNAIFKSFGIDIARNEVGSRINIRV